MDGIWVGEMDYTMCDEMTEDVQLTTTDTTTGQRVRHDNTEEVNNENKMTGWNKEERTRISSQ